MARLFLCLNFLILTFLALFHSCESALIKVVPASYKSAGVFLLIEGEEYTLNFTAARAACLSRNVTMATRAQIEEALQHGLETCKYGWIAEKIGVIPRLKSDNKCGKGKTGAATWHAPENTMFGVFCFNSSAAADLDKNQNTTTASLHSSTSLTALTQTSTPTAPSARSTITSPSSTKQPTTPTSPEQTLTTSASTPLVRTTLLSRISSSASPSHHTTVSPHHLTTSKPSVVNTAFTTSTQTFGSDLLQTSVSPANPSLKAVFTGLVILGSVFLLLLAAGAVWHYRLNTSCWYQAQQDDLETEMWKQTYSEMDPNDKHGPEEDHDEEDLDMNSCCDTTLCVNPDINANSE